MELNRAENTSGHWLTWWNHFIDVIIQLPYPDTSLQKLVFALKKYYQGQSTQLHILEEFERDYTRKNCIHWYTRETFLYRLVNKALRQENIPLLFLFGFFIRDLHLQLNEEYQIFKAKHRHNPLMTLYRGQIVSLTEIEKLEHSLVKQSPAEMTNKSFFSTSLHHSLASILLHPSTNPSDQFHTVLFKIDINLRTDCRPFADISHQSQFSNENEILFTIGAQFRVIRIFYDQGLYTIELKLTDDFLYGEHHYSHLSRCELLRECADLLFNTLPYASIEQIEACFTELSEIFSEEKPWLEALQYQALALRYQQDAIDHKQVIAMFEKALQCWKQCLNNGQLNCIAEIGQMHREIAHVYRQNIKDNELANQHDKLADDFSQDARRREEEEKTNRIPNDLK